MQSVRLAKTSVVCLCLLLVAFAVAACDGDDEATTTTSEATTTTTTLAEETTTTDTTTAPAPATVEVPNVNFELEADAISILSGVGLNSTVVYQSAYPAEHGRVIIMEPIYGSVVTVGTTITLTVGIDYDRAPVPNVVGMTLAEATIALHDANEFYPVVTELAVRNPDSWGKVISQDPAAGVELTMGASVNVTVGVASLPNPSISLPEITLPGF